MADRILVVEDERITAEHLRDILEDLGYEVTGVVSSGLEAVAAVEARKPDLALMDIRIKGDMDGTETAQALRSRFDVPVVYLTAHADRDTLNRSKRAEPLGYLVKPFQESELQASIEIALHKHREDQKSKLRQASLTSLLDAIGQGIISVDQNASVTLLNPAAETWTGWSEKDALGKPIEVVFQLIDPTTHGRIQAPFTQVLNQAVGIQELRRDVRLVPRSGGSQAITGSIAPVQSHDGRAAGAVIVFGGRADDAVSVAIEESLDDNSVGFGRFRMVAASPAMKQVVKFARRVAESEASTILLEGESGTGKDVMAQFMHHFGKRQAGPFVPLNCAAIPDTLLESELFGYEKGAFTDARSQKRGLLEIASGGTIFLDEIGEMPIVLQAKMLRVLEEQAFRRLGGLQDIHVDVRVLAATNRKLTEAVSAGKFRVDLYYRLNVIQVSLPPLRERRDDILPLAKHFIRVYNDKFRRQIQGISQEATHLLQNYEWPGNIRELRNTIERAMLLEDSAYIQPSSLQLPSDLQSPPIPIEEPIPQEPRSGEGLNLEQAERAILLRALEKTNWNQTQAAAMLGVSRDTLRYRIKKFNIRSE